MRRLLAALTVILTAQAGVTGAFDLQDDLDQRIDINNGYGGGVLRVASNHVVWQGVSGHLTHQGPPMVPAATFEIASTSKAFTAATVLLLVEDGELGIDQPIGELLPAAMLEGLLVIDGYDYTPEITVRQMLNHTAGLADYWNDPPFVSPGVNAFYHQYLLFPNRFWEPEEILEFVPGLTPAFAPGEGWHYSDTGYVLAGLIIEEITGKTLQEVYSERVFEPLQMHDTWLHWRDTVPEHVIESHRYEEWWDMYPRRHQSADWAGGGLVSSTADLEKFVRGLADDTLFSNPATGEMMMAWIPTGRPWVQYGLGLFSVFLGPGNGSVWGHDGYGNSFMYYWPKFDLSLVGGLNQTDNDWWPLVEAIVEQTVFIDSFDDGDLGHWSSVTR